MEDETISPNTEAEYVEVDGFGGWLYDIRNKEGKTFTFFAFLGPSGWSVMLGSPSLSELPLHYRQHILSNGQIQFRQSPASREEALALSAMWASDPSIALPAVPSQLVLAESTSPQPVQSSSAASIVPDADLLTQRVTQEVLGQEDAVSLLCQAVCKHIVKADPDRPLVLFAVGPAGTGKSKSIQVLVDALNELYPNINYSAIYINSSQYESECNLFELTGVSSIHEENRVNLMAALKSDSRRIVLWNEFEKAHPQITTNLIPFLSDKLISYTLSKDDKIEIDHSRSIYIFSINLQLQKATKLLKQDSDSQNSYSHFLIQEGQSYEFINLSDKILLYKPLNSTNIINIINKCIYDLSNAYKLEINFCDPSIALLILKQNRDESLGACCIRSIVNRILAPIFVAAVKQEMKGQVIIKRHLDRIIIRQI